MIPKKQFYRCLGTGHAPTDCHFKSAKCNKCHKTGHITKACQTRESTKQIKLSLKPLGQKSHSRKTKAPTNTVKDSPSSQSEPADIVHVDTASPHIPKSYKVLTTSNNNPVTMELDTGAGVTIVSEKTWADKLNKPELQDCELALQSYPNRSLTVLGSCMVEVSIHGQTRQLPLVVVEGDGISLLGRNWLESIRLDWTEVASIKNISKPTYQSKLDKLLDEYEEIFFCEELGHGKLHVKPEASPKFYRPRPIPLAMKEKIEEELSRLTNSGVITQVETSEWAKPTVSVKKPNGSVRPCGDYKVTINPYVNVNQHPLP